MTHKFLLSLMDLFQKPENSNSALMYSTQTWNESCNEPHSATDV